MHACRDLHCCRRYAELHCVSNFTFLRGASHPEELAARAAQLGYAALAITDECSLAGVVRAHVAAKEHGLKLIIGAEFRLADGAKLVLLATDREAYGNLSQLITLARRRSAKGSYHLEWNDVDRGAGDCLVLLIPEREPDRAAAHRVAGRFGGQAWIAVELLCGPDDRAQLERLRELGAACGLPLVAAGDVHMHVRSRRPLQDTLTADPPRHHRSPMRSTRCIPTPSAICACACGWRNSIRPNLLAETVRIAARCNFSLDSLRYEYPEELVPPGHTPAAYLRALTEEGLRARFPARRAGQRAAS